MEDTDTTTAVPEIRDGTDAVDTATGTPKREGDVPGDTPTPPRDPDPQQPVNAPEVPPVREGSRPVVGSVIISASEFESKTKSFFNPDVDKSFWDTLDQKIKEALSGNNADEIGQNMAFAGITFIFDAISNWAVHHRKEAKRVKKEYEEKTKAFDDVLKNTLVEKYGAIVEFLVKNGVDVRTPEGIKKLKELEKHPELLSLSADFVSAVLHREVRPNEASKLIEGTRKALEKGKITLDNPAIADVLRTQDAQDNAAYWDKRAKGQRISAKNIAQFRAQMAAIRRGEHEERRERPERPREGHDRAA